jgi:hypothetical protein
VAVGEGADPADQLVAVVDRHRYVGHEDVERARGRRVGDCVQRLRRRPDGGHFGTALLEQPLHDGAGVGFVLDQQHAQPRQHRRWREGHCLLGRLHSGESGVEVEGDAGQRELERERGAAALAGALGV